ncbi:MAG: hypothetical protein MUE93_03725 [Ignavibacteriaceae bacterium]|nr:hypothetical protein [Ignavibacteriaceae bacterium]
MLPQTDQPAELTLEDRKCGFGIVSDIQTNLEFFSPEKQGLLKSLLGRPPLQTSIVSPSGFFRIHYDATGSNRPSYVSNWTVEQNVAEVAKALDSVYRFEVTYLGFLSPPSDGTAGGDDKYDVYIQNQGGGVYGYTEWESKVGSVNWISFMVLDNDYVGYYTTSLNMEEFVYDDVNDYYAYMNSYFNNTDLAFPKQNGYNLAIWNIFIRENFDFGILKRQWEMIPSITAILAINQSLNERGTSFPRELNRFGIWTYFTGFRKIPGKYFEEGENYPLITPTFTIQFPSPPPDKQPIIL